MITCALKDFRISLEQFVTSLVTQHRMRVQAREHCNNIYNLAIDKSPMVDVSSVK